MFTHVRAPPPSFQNSSTPRPRASSLGPPPPPQPLATTTLHAGPKTSLRTTGCSLERAPASATLTLGTPGWRWRPSPRPLGGPRSPFPLAPRRATDFHSRSLLRTKGESTPAGCVLPRLLTAVRQPSLGSRVGGEREALGRVSLLQPGPRGHADPASGALKQDGRCPRPELGQDKSCLGSYRSDRGQRCHLGQPGRPGRAPQARVGSAESSCLLVTPLLSVGDSGPA